MRAPPTPAAGTRSGRGTGWSGWDERPGAKRRRRCLGRREPSRVEGGRARGWEQPAVGDRSAVGTGRREAWEAAAAGCGGRREEGAIGVGLGAGLSVLGVAGRSPPGRVCAEEEPRRSRWVKMSDWFTVFMTAYKALHVPAKSGKLRGFSSVFSRTVVRTAQTVRTLICICRAGNTCQQSIFRSEFYSVFRRLIVCLS